MGSEAGKTVSVADVLGREALHAMTGSDVNKEAGKTSFVTGVDKEAGMAISDVNYGLGMCLAGTDMVKKAG